MPCPAATVRPVRSLVLTAARPAPTAPVRGFAHAPRAAPPTLPVTRSAHTAAVPRTAALPQVSYTFQAAAPPRHDAKPRKPSRHGPHQGSQGPYQPSYQPQPQPKVQPTQGFQPK